jgi:Domain of unknown function (DUF4234)
MRTRTDRRVSPAWLLIPVGVVAVVLSYFVYIFVAIELAVQNPGSPPSTAFGPVLAGTGTLFAVLAILEIAWLYFIYVLIKRRNQHFTRHQRFVGDLVSVLREAGAKKGVNLEPILTSMDFSNRTAQIEESEKSAVLWTLLIIVPFVGAFVGLYDYYFLMKDFYKHERREDGVRQDTERALTALGVQFVFHRDEPVPNRSFAIYFIVTLVTFGLFGFYWVYTLIKDPNNHFAGHALYEGSLLPVLQPLLG